MTKFIEFGKRLLNDDEGATAIEYGLLAALIAVGIISLVGILGDTIAGAFDEINDEMAAEGAFAVD